MTNRNESDPVTAARATVTILETPRVGVMNQNDTEMVNTVATKLWTVVLDGDFVSDTGVLEQPCRRTK
ncbi:hypothetical protein ZOD2009_14791 [Haladaptatus paucihalophilus DX253]|uniref:Uncharacterized protein n=1 Tax=Haladaptatus paucihalophilus DX253 TaxID=797209 RepID=E7QVX0_HALPU|nr:hypothetical protein ZOD2009_14791 [Haladaptatus paucihalophilus DX253]GKZ14751.1 hypothetical protein HAL_26320 [Haladaptatus sp. T7]